MSQSPGAPTGGGKEDCTRCSTCDKGTCGTFQDVVGRKGQEFADNWWEKKEKIQAGKRDTANDNDSAAKVEFNSVAAQMTHLALHVTDIDASVDFYKKWAGMKEVDRRVSDKSGDTVVWSFSDRMTASVIPISAPPSGKPAWPGSCTSYKPFTGALDFTGPSSSGSSVSTHNIAAPSSRPYKSCAL